MLRLPLTWHVARSPLSQCLKISRKVSFLFHCDVINQNFITNILCVILRNELHSGLYVKTFYIALLTKPREQLFLDSARELGITCVLNLYCVPISLVCITFTVQAAIYVRTYVNAYCVAQVKANV